MLTVKTPTSIIEEMCGTLQTRIPPILERIQALMDENAVLRAQNEELMRRLQAAATPISPPRVAIVPTRVRAVVGGGTISALFATTTLKPAWVGPFVVNLAILEGYTKSTPPDEKWVQSKFVEIDDLKVNKVMLLLNNQLPQPKPLQSYKEVTDVRQLSTSLQGVLLKDRLIKELGHLQNAPSLDELFKKFAYIAKDLLSLQLQLEPILKRYEQIKDSFVGTPTKPGVETLPQRFEKAQTILSGIKNELGSLRAHLCNKQWTIKKT